MTLMFLQYLFLLICIHSNVNIDAVNIYPTRRAKVNIIPNSFYVPAYYKHFIYNISGIQSISKCMYNCQNHDYCRTAVYSSQSSICSLYEEYSFVGSVLPALQKDQSVLSFSFCPNSSYSEPMYVCEGSLLIQPITIGNLITQLLLTIPTTTISAYTVVSAWSTTVLTFAPMWHFDRCAGYTYNQFYNYTITNTPVPGEVIIDMDTDDYQYYSIVDWNGYLYLRSSSVNATIRPTSMRGICMSDRYTVAFPSNTTGQKLYVYWKSNGSQAFLLPAPVQGICSCLVINNTLFTVGNPPDPAIQSIPLQSSLTINNYSQIISYNQCQHAFRPLKIDSSGRLFVVCTNNSISNMLIFTTNGTMLAYLSNSFFSYVQLGVKATKYRFSLSATDSSSSTYIYDF